MPTPPSDAEALKSRNRLAFRATRRILKLVRSSRERSQIGPCSADARVFSLMLDKAEKTAKAALLLADRGYVEDAFILARSLVNLAGS